MKADVQQTPELFTYIARGFFLLMLVLAFVRCWDIVRSVRGWEVQFDAGAFWVLCLIAGANVWVAHKRGSVAKSVADMLLTMLGVILGTGSQLAYTLAGLPR